jgi:hypothetical protein
MSKGARGDVARQIAVMLGAIFQIAVPIFTGPVVGRVSGENPTLIVPAEYAFVIWTLIFLLALIYAVYQALPSKRESPLLRRIGWFSALAYFSNGIWEIVFPAREFVLSQIVFVGISGGAVGAFILVQRGAGSGLVTVLVATGVLGGGIGEALFGALMLIVGGAVACSVVLAGRNGPVQGYLAYGGAVLWALVGVVANQYQSSLITSFTSILCALLVAAILITALRRSGATRGAGQPSSPRVV